MDGVASGLLCHWCPQLHGVVLKGLEAVILRYTLGEESSKYLNAKSEYDAKVAQAWGA